MTNYSSFRQYLFVTAIIDIAYINTLRQCIYIYIYMPLVITYLECTNSIEKINWRKSIFTLDNTSLWLCVDAQTFNSLYSH